MSSDFEKPLVLLTHAIPEDWLVPLTQACRVEMGPADTIGFSDDILARLPDAQGLITLLMDRVDESILSRAARLKVVSNLAAGYDNIDLDTCRRLGIAVGNTPGVLTDATADLTMALLLSAARRLLQAAQDARSGAWKNWAPAGWLGADLAGRTIGIVGMGKIGIGVARRAHGFGLKILYTNETPVPSVEEELGARQVTLDELLRVSDFISLHVPLTATTRGMIDANAFKKMKPSAILVNAARGAVVDTDALVTALQEKQIAGAALDVVDPEPLPPDHPLYRLPACLIVPHIGSATTGTRRKMAEMAIQNLLAGLEGKALPYPVVQRGG